MNYAVCWECLLNNMITMNVSDMFLPRVPRYNCSVPLDRASKNIMFKTQSASNQRHESSLVGTSETICVAPYSQSFCEWLAGLIDGDGSLKVSKQGYPCLRFIQNKPTPVRLPMPLQGWSWTVPRPGLVCRIL
jgi:hypothetical protein